MAWKRALTCSAMVTLLVACGGEEYSGPVDLNGSWGWGSLSNCEDDTSVWNFRGELWEIRRRSEVVERREFTFERAADSNLLTLTYLDSGSEITRRLRIERGGDQIRLVGGTVNGASDPDIEFQINNVWVRCPR